MAAAKTRAGASLGLPGLGYPNFSIHPVWLTKHPSQPSSGGRWVCVYPRTAYNRPLARASVGGAATLGYAHPAAAAATCHQAAHTSPAKGDKHANYIAVLGTVKFNYESLPG